MAESKEKDEVQITKLKIKIGGETKELTVEQARKLYFALGELFAEPKVRVEKEYVYWPRAFWYEYKPIMKDYSDQWIRPNWIYCSKDDKSNQVQFLSLEVK